MRCRSRASTVPGTTGRACAPLAVTGRGCARRSSTTGRMARGTSSTRRSTPAVFTSPRCWARSWEAARRRGPFCTAGRGCWRSRRPSSARPGSGRRFAGPGRVTPLRHLRSGSGIAMPSTGMRANGNALCNPMVEPVLAHVLGLEHRTRQPRRWRDWQPPRDKKEWSRSGSPPNPFAYLETVRQAEARSGVALKDQPFNAFCAKAVQGDMEAWRELANAVEGAERAAAPRPRPVRDRAPAGGRGHLLGGQVADPAEALRAGGGDHRRPPTRPDAGEVADPQHADEIPDQRDGGAGPGGHVGRSASPGGAGGDCWNSPGRD